MFKNILKLIYPSNYMKNVYRLRSYLGETIFLGGPLVFFCIKFQEFVIKIY